MATKPKGRKPAASKSVVTSNPDQVNLKWQLTAGMALAGQEAIDDAQMAAVEMERKWGRGRLRLLVDAELREKFDRQRYLFSNAIWKGELPDVQREAKRMVAAYRALDRRATETGMVTLPATVWEVALSDGAVAVIVKEPELAYQWADGRRANVYTLEEIGRLIEGFPMLAKVKEAFPGATVERIGDEILDPLADVRFDVGAPLDDVQGFEDDKQRATWKSPPRNKAGNIISPKTDAINDSIPF